MFLVDEIGQNRNIKLENECSQKEDIKRLLWCCHMKENRVRDECIYKEGRGATDKNKACISVRDCWFFI